MGSEEWIYRDMETESKEYSVNIDYYNKNAEAFFQETIDADMSFWRDKFIALLPDGGRILDAGCGSGRDSKAFIQNGFSVVAFDASMELCKLASEYISQEVWQMRFEEMSFDEEFDGVWACASLLHVPKEDMKDVLERIYNSLQKGGIFYASFKYGDGMVQRGERLFTDYNENNTRLLFKVLGFEIIECDESLDKRPGREEEKWINVISKKC